MSNQSFVFNLKIKINENNEGEVLYNNSSSKLKYDIFCYMNDKISCHTSLYNSYYNADIEVRKEEVTPITGITATAFIKVKDEMIKSNTTISADNTMDFNFAIPYISIQEDSIEGKFQIIIIDAEGNKIHTPIIPIDILKPIGDIYKVKDLSSKFEQSIQEKSLKRYVVEENSLIFNSKNNYYEIVLTHQIESLDGNIFVSVIGEDKFDRVFNKVKISKNALKIQVIDKEKLYITIRK